MPFSYTHLDVYKRQVLYTTNATVAALNHVPGFDPLKFLRRTISRKTGDVYKRQSLRRAQTMARFPICFIR